MGAGRHLLLIPDGSRRHARREYLRAMLAASEREFETRLAELPAGVAARVRERIVRCVREGSDPGRDSLQRDVLDEVPLEVPASYHLESYRQGVRVLEPVLEWLSSEREVSELSLYAMQPSNLQRADGQALGFLRAEAECYARWSEDRVRTERCTFRFVGDQSLLDPGRWRPALRPTLVEYGVARERLTRAGQGGDLVINLLAPYDYVWEINQAIVNGRFDPGSLVVRTSVDLTIRTGSNSRSVFSGALPCQSAFSPFVPMLPYFPDCRLEDFQQVIGAAFAPTRSSGL